VLPMQPVSFPNEYPDFWHRKFANPALIVGRLTWPAACLVPLIIGLVKVPQSNQAVVTAA